MPYSKLSVSQIRYLIAIYNLNPSGTSLSEVAASLGVSKASAHKMLMTLDKIDVVIKEPYGGIGLTEKGKSIAKEIKENYLKIMHFFVENMKLSPVIADKDALNFISYMSEDLVGKFINQIETENEEADTDIYIDTLHSDFKNIISDPGCYEVPFKLLKYDGKTVSMGNKALKHPCRIEVSDKKTVIRIKAKKITHRSLSGIFLSGKLSRLCYWNGRVFLDAKMQNDTYEVPIFGDDLQRDEPGIIRNCTLLLKVYASVGVINMPVSEAKLRLNLASRRKIL